LTDRNLSDRLKIVAIENKWGVIVMINARLLQLAAVGFCLAPSSGAFASTITSADITISNLTITSDQSFHLASDNGPVTAQAGLDSFGHSSGQTFPISGTTAADATISTSTAHADSTGPSFNLSSSSVTVPTTSSVSSSVNLVGGSSSLSSGIANPIYQFLVFSNSSTIALTFSMTFSGSLSGSADALGTYTSEVTAQFGYQSNSFPNPFIPVVSFDQPLSGGPSDSQNDVIGPTTLTGTITLLTNVDYFFYASAEAQSSGSELGTTPLPATLPLFATGLGALGLLGWRRKRKAQAA
jgi:hypothetical protein